MELLSPAGNMNALKAAVRCNANAVYLGLNKFNARKNADNFSNEEFIKAVKYLKQNNVKCYVAVNTLIKNEEFGSAAETAVFCYNNGADGLILQDVGLIEYLHKNYPEIRLHASTQLSVHNALALPTLYNLGIKRVVLARELTKEEIKEICAKAKEYKIETEVFVHGALCMSVSGQCLISASLGGRSANRGLCAGTCRLPFKAKSGNGYDLSLKDLCLIKKLKELKDIGVTSLKIEGRMKNEEYVAASAYNYSLALKNTEKPENTVKNEKTENFDLNLSEKILKNTFSRSGFTQGFFENRINKDIFGIRSESDKDATKETLGKIHELYRRENQHLPLNISILIKKGEFSVKAECMGIKTRVLGNAPKKAQNKPVTEEFLKEKFLKLGNTPFYLNEFKVKTEETESGFFVDDINTVKEQVIQNILKTAENNLPVPLNFNKTDFENNFKALKNSLTNLNNNYNNGATQGSLILNFRKSENFNKEILKNKDVLFVAMPLNEIEKTGILKTEETEYINKLAVALPRFEPSEQKILNILKRAKEKNIKNILATNIAFIDIAFSMGFCVLGDIGLNVFNSFTLNRFLNKLKIVTLSAELSEKEIEDIKGNDLVSASVFAYGKLPLMLNRCCPLKKGEIKNNCLNCEHKITDRLGISFPVYCQNGYTEIFNAKTTNIGTVKNKFNMLLFTDETQMEVEKITNEFLNKSFNITNKNTKWLYKNGVI